MAYLLEAHGMDDPRSGNAATAGMRTDKVGRLEVEGDVTTLMLG